MERGTCSLGMTDPWWIDPERLWDPMKAKVERGTCSLGMIDPWRVDLGRLLDPVTELKWMEMRGWDWGQAGPDPERLPYIGIRNL